MSKAIQVKTLLGHSQVDLACRCLGSLAKYCADAVEFIVHEDGTLVAPDVDRLSEVLNIADIVYRTAADAQVEPLLERYPACAKYRSSHVLGLKLFDICLLDATGEPFYFCDSDVLFVRPFRFPAPIERGSLVFMRDSQQAFALRPWHVKPFGPIEIISKANTGLLATYASNLDLRSIEAVLANSRLSHVFGQRPQWVEQTCWAILGAGLTASLFDANQVVMATQSMGQPTLEQVAIHFVSTHRGQIDNYFAGEPKSLGAAQLALTPAPRASASDLLHSEIERRRQRKKRG